MEIPSKGYILMAVGALAAVLTTSYVPSLMKVMSTSYPPDYASYPGIKEKPYKLEDIPGIDTYSLFLAREKGII